MLGYSKLLLSTVGTPEGKHRKRFRIQDNRFKTRGSKSGKNLKSKFGKTQRATFEGCENETNQGKSHNDNKVPNVVGGLSEGIVGRFDLRTRPNCTVVGI